MVWYGMVQTVFITPMQPCLFYTHSSTAPVIEAKASHPKPKQEEDDGWGPIDTKVTQAKPTSEGEPEGQRCVQVIWYASEQ